jgi:hypothetical protein
MGMLPNLGTWNPGASSSQSGSGSGGRESGFDVSGGVGCIEFDKEIPIKGSIEAEFSFSCCAIQAETGEQTGWNCEVRAEASYKFKIPILPIEWARISVGGRIGCGLPPDKDPIRELTRWSGLKQYCDGCFTIRIKAGGIWEDWFGVEWGTECTAGVQYCTSSSSISVPIECCAAGFGLEGCVSYTWYP